MALDTKQERWIDWLYYIAMAGLLLWFGYSRGWILADFESVDPAQAIEVIRNDKNITLLDVRTPAEYQSGHLKGAQNIPLDTLEKKLGLLDKKRKILVYCRSGSRSISASRILERHAYTPVNIKEGIIGLSKAGARIVK